MKEQFFFSSIVKKKIIIARKQEENRINFLIDIRDKNRSEGPFGIPV